MERGANTFPFHNLLPYSESNEGLFLFFSPSLNWIKEKSVATLAIRNICDTKISKSVHRITDLATLSGRHPKERITLGIFRSSLPLSVWFACFIFKSYLGIKLVGDPTPGSR